MSPEKHIREKTKGINLTENNIKLLCNYFKISYEAMCYRLKTLSYISENKCLEFINNNIRNFYEETEIKKMVITGLQN